MAQAEGGNAGDSSSHGNGSMGGNSGNGGGLGGGLGGSNGGNGGGNNSSANSASTSNSAANAASASTAAAASDSKQTGGIMGGLSDAVGNARSSRATNSVSGSIQGAVNNAFGGTSPASSAMSTGYNSPGQVSNDVGAMNTQAAKDKAESQMGAFKTGYRNEANAGMTQSAFGATGDVGGLVGAGIGAAVNQNGFATDSDEANAAKAGGALAQQNGMSGLAKGAISAGASLLGGPVAGMIASMLTGAYSYSQQREGMPSAFEGQTNTTPTGPIAGGNANFANSTGTDTAPVSGMTAAMSGAAQNGFQAASDYSGQRDVSGLNLGSII